MIAADVRRDIEALPQLVQLADTFFSREANDSTARYAVELALEEMFTNMVKYNANGAGDIRVELAMRGGEVIVRLTDFDAPRFDPFADAPAADVGASLGERTPGGLGVHLVKKMMDRIEYSHADRTSTVTLYKRVN